MFHAAFHDRETRVESNTYAKIADLFAAMV